MKTQITVTHSTKDLTKSLAMSIYTDIRKYGSADICFKSVNTNYDYTNVEKVDKEADRVISVINVLGTDENITTITNAKSMVDTFLDKNVVFSDVLDGKTWKEFQLTFKTDDSL